MQGVGHYLARDGEDEGERVIGHLVDAVVRDVAHRDATFAGSRAVHIVVAHAIANDGFGLGHGMDDVRVDGGELGDHRIGIAHQLSKLCRRTLFFEGNDLDARWTKNRFFQAEIRKGVISNGYGRHG